MLERGKKLYTETEANVGVFLWVIRLRSIETEKIQIVPLKSVHDRLFVLNINFNKNWNGRLRRQCVNTSIQSLDKLEFKRGFVDKAAVSRAVRLRECPLRLLRLYRILV